MFNRMTINKKLFFAFLALMIIVMTAASVIGFRQSRDSLSKAAFEKLTSLREMKAFQIEDYLDFITRQLVFFSKDRMVVEAMRDMGAAFSELESELAPGEEKTEEINALQSNYYEREFLARLEPNLPNRPVVGEYLPTSMNSLLLQHLYISSNPYSTGSKDFLNDAGDGSSYSHIHREIHPIFRDYLLKFGYYDIFLIDLDRGEIVYTVFKEVDVGTSLLEGPYAETGLARVFRAARDADSPDFVVVDDFEPYHPSYNSAAAFIASPIYEGDEPIGVLAFQMPIDRINLIMTNDQNWADVGLGESGETYIVASDFKLRNQSRFLIEDSENYLRMIEETGKSPATIERIRNLNSSIGLQEVRTEGTRDALAGHSDTRIFNDYRGVPVLSSYRPLDIDGLNWAIMSEIDKAEAFATIGQLARKLLLTVALLLLFTIVAAGLVARTITRPLAQLGRNSRALASGNLEVQIDTSSGDEIGDLSRDFEHMRRSLKKAINELELLNANLEQKVTDRTAKLAASEQELAKANARMLDELNFAREIQMSMVPLLFPVFPDRPELALHAVLEPAREVGGDFYDFYFLDDNQLCMVMADVAGKGAPAALFMAVSKTLIKSRAANDFEPSSILTQVNGELSENNTTATFVTVFLAVLDVSTGLVRYCNAGHNPPLIKLESGQLKKLDSLHGPILGVIPGLTYTQDEFLMAAGDTLLMFTDGINEAMNEEGEEYTDQRLENLLSNSNAKSPGELSDEVIADVRDHRGAADQSDDITLLAIKYRGLRLGADQNLAIRIGNKISEIASVEEQFHEFSNRNGIQETDRQTVSLVLDDLLNNIISYAWPEGGDHEIMVDLTRYGSRLVLTVEDDGIPFNPFAAHAPSVELSLQERDIGGLGIHLVQQSMDEYVYQRRANRNVVILVRNLRDLE